MGLNLFNVAVSSTPPLCKAVYEHLHPARRTQIEKTSAARKEIKYSLSWVLIKVRYPLRGCADRSSS